MLDPVTAFATASAAFLLIFAIPVLVSMWLYGKVE